MNFLKRTIPLMITAGVGFVLIVASFIPATVSWGEVAMVWFDILAAVAFILGGGNLLKVQLKKISDQAAGWGYALVTLVAFLVTLFVGLFKVGSPPAPNQEFYGQVFVKLSLDELPESQTFRVAGSIPRPKFDPELPASVRRQLSEEKNAEGENELVFKGWIRPNQVADLKGYNSTLEWLCAVETLAKTAQPPEPLRGKISYFVDHESLAFAGNMSTAERQALHQMANGNQEDWRVAIRELAKRSHRTVKVNVDPPPRFSVPDDMRTSETIVYDGTDKSLSFTGPMSEAQRDTLIAQFPIVVPLTDAERATFRQEIESRGEALTEDQVEEFQKVLEGTWTAQPLIEAINAGGVYKATEKTACDLLAARNSGQTEEPEEKGQDVRLSSAQVDFLKDWIETSNRIDPMPADQLSEELSARLENLGPLTDGHKAALNTFLESQPTIGERNQNLYFALEKRGPVTAEQKAFLLADIQAQMTWQKQIVRLFQQAHQVKYEWSGDYREQGTPFWWIYEFLFKPLTATMFALLAFYVASAAFRAFRAKNLEASLLLGTAFIILLGRTFAGVMLTSWIPESLSGLRIENLAVYIMQVFNTAGNRAIMIGIALGIASTSLKVLLGIDRSYLGSSED